MDIQLDDLPDAEAEAGARTEPGISTAPDRISPEAAIATDLANKLDLVCLHLLRYVHATVCGCGGLPGHGANSNVPVPHATANVTAAPTLLLPPKATAHSHASASTQRSSFVADTATAASAAVDDAFLNRVQSALTIDAGADCSALASAVRMAETQSHGGRTDSSAMDGTPAHSSSLASNGAHASHATSAARNSTAVAASTSTVSGTSRKQQSKAAADAEAAKTAREHAFALMLGVFERSVLLTHRSKFTQASFLSWSVNVIHLCSFCSLFYFIHVL